MRFHCLRGQIVCWRNAQNGLEWVSNIFKTPSRAQIVLLDCQFDKRNDLDQLLGLYHYGINQLTDVTGKRISPRQTIPRVWFGVRKLQPNCTLGIVWLWFTYTKPCLGIVWLQLMYAKTYISIVWLWVMYAKPYWGRIILMYILARTPVRQHAASQRPLRFVFFFRQVKYHRCMLFDI